MIFLQRRIEKKTILAGLSLVVFLVLMYFSYALSQNTRTYGEALYVKQQKLVKYRQKVLGKKGMERQHSILEKNLKRAELSLLAGKTPPLAAAEIQEIIGSFATAAGAQITTVRILQPDSSGSSLYLAIPVEVTIHSTMRELTQLLYKLERSAKLLRITRLEIKTRRGYTRRKGAGKQEGPVNIVTTLTAEGFVKKVEA